MGIIQGSINQLLTLSAGAAYLSPNTKTRAQLTDLEKQETVVNRKEELGSITMQEGASERARIAEERAVLKPTEKNITAAYDRATESMVEDIKAENRIKKQQKAEKEAQEQLQLEQERRAKSEQFRIMFTEGGKWK